MGYKVPKVLVISKRVAEMCATKALLNRAGFDVAVVTNVATAAALARAVAYRAAVVCFHTFNASERDQIESELKASNPDLQIVARCPGCLGCEEGRANVIGVLPAADPVIPGVIAALGSV